MIHEKSLSERQRRRYVTIITFLCISMISIVSFCVGKYFDRVKTKLFKTTALTNKILNGDQHLCSIDKINNVPDDSLIIVGHAYGSGKGSARRNHEGIAPSIKSLIEKNKSRISGIIFTGDIFSIPSEKKWNNLYQLTQPLPVYIAPGNHDVFNTLDNAFRDIFNKRITAQSAIYPQSIVIDDTLFIIDDSNLKNSSDNIGKYILQEIKKRPSIYSAILVRHHVLSDDLRHVQNSESPSKYWSKSEFSTLRKSLPENKEIKFIYGDGGAHPFLPRMTCTSISGFINIVNGIGELKDDRIIIFKKGKLYSYIVPVAPITSKAHINHIQ